MKIRWIRMVSARVWTTLFNYLHASLKLEEGTRTPILSVQKLVHDVHELKQKLSWKYTARYLDNHDDNFQRSFSGDDGYKWSDWSLCSILKPTKSSLICPTMCRVKRSSSFSMSQQQRIEHTTLLQRTNTQRRRTDSVGGRTQENESRLLLDNFDWSRNIFFRDSKTE